MKKIVRVNWLDAYHQGDDLDDREAHNLQPARSISFGVLLEEDEQKVIVSGHVFSSPGINGDAEITYRESLCIPRGCVLSIDVLGELEELKG